MRHLFFDILVWMHGCCGEKLRFSGLLRVALLVTFSFVFIPDLVWIYPKLHVHKLFHAFLRPFSLLLSCSLILSVFMWFVVFVAVIVSSVRNFCMHDSLEFDIRVLWPENICIVTV